MTIFRLFLFLVAAGLALTGWSYWSAVSDPVIRETEVQLSDWPEAQAGIRLVLMSDLHVAGPDMPPGRLERIVAQVNPLKADVVVIAGDFVSDKRVATRTYAFAEAVAPLARLTPRLGTFAVLGNHDHWRNADEARRTLAANGITTLANEAVRAGPLALGGLDDAFTGHDDVSALMARLRTVPGSKIVLSHSPDPFPRLPSEIGLTLAGHTHCGQIRLPLIGALSTMSAYGDRYACGRVDEGGKTLIVGAGLGTSLLPLRLGAAPDLWLIRLGPVDRESD